LQRLEDSIGRLRLAIKARKQLNRLPHRQLLGKASLLQRNSDFFP
jgi:hypothetical protein